MENNAVSIDVQLFGIEVEKMLCEKLGRKWTSSGICIESLINELSSQSFAPIGYKLVPVNMTEEMFDALADSPWIVECETRIHDNVVRTINKEFRDQRYVEDGWNAILASVPESKEVIEQKKQLIVMRALETGQWQICRNLPSTYLTDEANDESKWSIRRQEAPFCDKKGKRQWEGRTAFDALLNAKMDLGL
ncbi:MAG TPA: hypothetical protein VFM18_12705 [Methanosarcina sp.]|nr:hypothetical protein [Methanosarcina sp.]